MAPRPICEPVELPPGASVLVDRVAHPENSTELGRLLHFHDVSELVLFERVDGAFWANGRRSPLTDGTATFIPSMRHHDFVLKPGRKAWHLIQIDPYIVEELAHQPRFARLLRAFAAQPSPAARARIASLVEWLETATLDDPRDPLVVRLVELLLIAVTDAPEIGGHSEPESDAHVERLLPALERLRQDPRTPVPLETAAAACNLSPAYFSRRFKRVFGMNFTDYTRVYRLHLAARRLLAGGAPVSEIAYAIGFSSPSHFTARFHERFGVTPRAYRAGARKRAA